MLTNRDRIADGSYDLRRFDRDDEELKKQTKRNLDMKKRFENPNTASSRKGNWFFVVMLAALVFAVLVIHISGKIELEKVSSNTVAISERIDEANRENEYLRTTLQAMATPAKVEEYAAENGLMRERFSQVTHISVNVDDIVEVVDTDDNDIFIAVNQWFGNILEFLGVS